MKIFQITKFQLFDLYENSNTHLLLDKRPFKKSAYPIFEIEPSSNEVFMDANVFNSNKKHPKENLEEEPIREVTSKIIGQNNDKGHILSF